MGDSHVIILIVVFLSVILHLDASAHRFLDFWAVHARARERRDREILRNYSPIKRSEHIYRGFVLILKKGEDRTKITN